MDHQSNHSGHTSPSFNQSIEQHQHQHQNQTPCSPVCDRLPLLSTNYPWLVTQNKKGGKNPGDQSLCIVHDQHVRFECRIPEMLGRRIRGCFHGWVILSDEHNVMWSLWNPVTSKFIRLPPLVLKSGDLDDFGNCCLSSDPDDPSSSSILLLPRSNKPNLVFCRLDGKRKKSRWIEMSYAKQLKSLGDVTERGDDDDFLYCLTCSNGKVYALTTGTSFLVHVDIVVRGTEVVISLLRDWDYPFPFFFNSLQRYYSLKGCGTELFCIMLGFDAVAKCTLADAYLFKLDMTNTMSTWEEIKDLKDAVFFVDLCNHNAVFYNHGINSELGGYVHVRSNVRNRIYSYLVKDRTVSLIAMPPLTHTTDVSLWECRLEGDNGEAKYTIEYKHKQDNKDEIRMRSVTNDEVRFYRMTNESHLVNIPFHILERIMEFCVGIEFMKFRATCKRCRLAAPLIQWRTEAALTKLRAYSLASPLLMVIEENRGIMNLTDPIFGDKYFMNTSDIASHEEIVICCSRYGWLLFYSNLGYLVFFNPFTSDVHQLPTTALLLEDLCFSAPPTTPNCMVVGFTTKGAGHAYILHFVAPEPLWRRVDLDYGGDAPYVFRFPTFYGRDLYALCEGELVVFKEIRDASFSWEVVVAEAPKCRWSSLTQYFLVKRDQHLLLVIMGVVGERLEVFQLNDSTKEWKKIDSLGGYTIYISDNTCFCIEAKTPKMQNKIYLSRLHTKNGGIVFYSLETCGYYAFDGENVEETAWHEFYFGTKYHLYPCAWIEPNWC